MGQTVKLEKLVGIRAIEWRLKAGPVVRLYREATLFTRHGEIAFAEVWGYLERGEEALLHTWRAVELPEARADVEALVGLA